MLINLDNHVWINKNHILLVDQRCIIDKKPSILYRNDKTVFEELRKRDNDPFYYNICMDNYSIDIYRRVEMKLTENREASLTLLSKSICINDLGFNPETKEEYVALFIATMQLDNNHYETPIVNNDVLIKLNELLEQEEHTNKLSLKFCLQNYCGNMEGEEQINKLKERILRDLEPEYEHLASSFTVDSATSPS